MTNKNALDQRMTFWEYAKYRKFEKVVFTTEIPTLENFIPLREREFEGHTIMDMGFTLDQYKERLFRIRRACFRLWDKSFFDQDYILCSRHLARVGIDNGISLELGLVYDDIDNYRYTIRNGINRFLQYFSIEKPYFKDPKIYERTWHAGFYALEDKLTKKLKDKEVLGITGEIYHQRTTGNYTDSILLALRLNKELKNDR